MTKIQLQLTDRDRREAAWNCCFDCGEAYDKNHESDKGEQCVYCGKDSWTCEHFEPPAFDGEDAEEWQRRSEEQGE